MQQLAFYLIKVIACTGILLLYYKLALRNKRFHYYNRFYLLATIAASLLLPLLEINWFTISSNDYSAIALLNVITVRGSETATNTVSSHAVNWQQVTIYAYVAVSLLFIALLLWRVQKIYAFKRRYSATNMGEFDFINTDLTQAPFSFLQNLFWRNDIDLNDTTGRQILQHELTHIRQKHSWDKLFIQAVLSVFWINPFYWFIQKELYMLHEFIADEKAIENNDGAAFAAMLLTSQYGKNAFSPASPFAYSPIKRRLFMLTNLAKPRYSYARRLMVLPLLAAVILLFAFRVQNQEQIAIKEVNLTGVASSPFKVVIDAGHGGEDDGNQAGGVAEKDITLNIAQKIKEYAPQYNIEAALTRGSDATLSEDERVAFAKSQNAGACISIHADYTANTSQRGINVYVDKDNKNFDDSKLLGSAVVQYLSTQFTVIKTLKQSQQTINILKSNPAAAILIECGAMSNNADLKAMTDDAKTTVIAKNILTAISKFANSKVPASTGLVKEVIVDGSYVPKRDTTPPAKPIEIRLNYSSPDTSRPQPLIIVDGKEQPIKVLQQISPNTIESISVLKDKTAIDKYGEKAANGVIEIHLKPVVTITDIKLDKATNNLKLNVNEKPVQIKLTDFRPTSKTQTKNEITIVADSITFKPAVITTTDTLKLRKPY